MTEVETVETPSPAVAVAAGMTADDLISQWTEQEDGKETKDEVEATEESDKEEADSVSDREGDGDEEGESPDIATETVSEGSGTGKEAVAEDKAKPGVVDGKSVEVEASSVAPLPPELAEIETLIDSEEYDPFDVDSQKKVIKTLIGTVKAQQDVIEQSRKANAVSQQEKFWQDYATKNPDVGMSARKLWEEAIDKHAKLGRSGTALQAAAEVEWEFRVQQAKGAAKARAGKPDAKPAPKVTPGAARVSPVVTRNKPPQSARTYEEKLVSGAYGDLASQFAE